MWSTGSSVTAWRPVSLRLEEGGGELLHPQTHKAVSSAQIVAAERTHMPRVSIVPGSTDGEIACPHRVSAARRKSGAALGPGQLRPDPILELPYRILLRHQYAPGVRQGAQSALIEFADFGILTHDDVGELNRVHEVAFRIGQRFGQEEKLDAHLRSLRSERPQTYDAHVVHVCHDEHGRTSGQIHV